MTEEVVDIVDESGQILHRAAKSMAHKRGLLHKAVIGYIRQGDKWLLVSQAADKQEPGLLVAPVGGHVRAGEENLDALIREAEEEIGTRNIRHKFVGLKRFHRTIIGRDENHLFYVYEISTDDDIVLGPEADSITAFTDLELKQALLDKAHLFGDAYYFVLEHFYADLLPVDYKPRWKVE